MNSQHQLVVLAFFLVLLDISFAANGVIKSQDVGEKLGSKKDKDVGKEYHRFEDWGGQDWSEAEMMQHPIDEAPRRENRGLGDVCSYSKDCGSGCCLMERDSRSRSCQPLASWGDKCSIGQVKGDLYVDACPCESGPDFCSFPAGTCSG